MLFAVNAVSGMSELRCQPSVHSPVPALAYLESMRPGGLGLAVNASRAVCQAESPG
jgi:hypothetical protein